MADVLAGYLIVAAGALAIRPLMGLVVATGCIYSLGCVLNDLVDREVDRVERPWRPIPSQAVTIAEGVFITFILAALALLGAAVAGLFALITACVLIFFVVFYDMFSKQHPFWGPLGMALCRAFNLLLGMSPHVDRLGAYAVLPLLTLGYVFSLTVLSRLEVGQRERRYGVRVGIGWGVFLIGAMALVAMEFLQPLSLIYFLGLVGVAVPSVVVALKSLRASEVQDAVKKLVLGIVAVDAFYVSGVHGFLYGLPIMVCLFPSVYLARRFYVT